MINWEMKIKKVENGYICEIPEELAEGENTIKLYQETDKENSELETMKELLYDIKEYFGIFNSKHKKFNLNIYIEENKNE